MKMNPAVMASAATTINATTSLNTNTYCVFDLETTGDSPTKGAMITEIGAVMVRDDKIADQFTSLVNPEIPIPSFITELTGITNAMVATAPRVEEALGDFLRFAHGCTLVAHNAPFDIGFVDFFSRRLRVPQRSDDVIDTIEMAHALLPPGAVPNHKLSSLATYFDSAVAPNHRALPDALATAAIFVELRHRAR